MENPIKMDDLGGAPIFGNIHILPSICITLRETNISPPNREENHHLQP